MRRAWAYGGLCLTTVACAGLLGIEGVDYASEDSSDASDDGVGLRDASGDSTSDGPCTADLTQDPMHCGSCAHRCGVGGRCTGGLCAPELVLSGLLAPHGLLRIAGSTYVGTGSGVYRCTSTGCGDAGEPLLVANANEAITGFAADDAGTFVAILTLGGLGLPGGRVVSCPLGPCTSPLVLATSQVNLRAVARSDVDVLWGRTNTIGQQELVSCPGAACGGDGTVIGTSSSLLAATSIDGRGSSVLWMVGARLHETTRDGGTALVAAIGASSDQPLARDGDHAYWGNAEARLIEQCGLAAGCASTRSLFVSAGGPPRALALDGSHLYMAVGAAADDSGTTGFIGRTPRGGGTKIVEVLARSNEDLRALTVDGTHVYWAEANGNVWRVPK